jgi:succinate dehydrogenase cytochrome b556 subunit
MADSITMREHLSTRSKGTGIPLLGYYANTRGWFFVVSWFHRITGIILILFVCYHIFSLTSLYSPEAYSEKIQIFRLFIFAFLEWALAIPVIFHALNGGRLILYESFGMRNDESAIRWMVGLCILYVGLLSLLMLMGNQKVSAPFFWITFLATSLAVGYGVALRVCRTQNSVFWKLQRITGAFLLLMIPAHLLFMHLNPSVAKEANQVIMRMQNDFIKAVDLCLVIGIIYHGVYGLFSIFADYLPAGIARIGLSALVLLIMVLFALVGIKLILYI